MRKTWIGLTVCATAVLAAACDRGGGGGGEEGLAKSPEELRALAVPAEHQDGRQLFDANCMQCHGQAALGTNQGPPLVHIVYEPNHHGDFAFYRAAQQGVQAHHWSFGNMPPVAGVTQEQVTEIIGYVRWLQREAGIH